MLRPFQNYQLSLYLIPALLFSILTLFPTPNYAAATDLSNVSNQAIVRPKLSPVISSRTLEYLRSRDGDQQVTAWVYFTDKGVRRGQSLASASNAVRFPERTRIRRAKMNLDEVLYVDLPVVSTYVEQVLALGGEHRRSSRWLNAASFELPLAKIDDIAALSFVAEIKPVIKFSNPIEQRSDNLKPRMPNALNMNMLNYGSSLGQLNQINVPAVHNAGLSGKGVTLAIMDTGFRKTHEAFATAFAEGRVLAEYDFVFDDGNTAIEPEDVLGQWNHGTLIWGASGGYLDGKLYGPAYEANFILCKTEDLASETPVEEDNWVAALEFADSVGADVVTTSLGYSDWYTYSDFDGLTATITIAANTADSLGIIVCNSMGNGGPANGTLTAPADAFGILAVGAVNSSGVIATFSSRGPTFDGRPKPEVVAQGVSTYTSTASTNTSYGFASGTSLSTPLVAGAACLVLQANPCFTPAQVRDALMLTASRAENPDSTTYGWGIIDAAGAIDYSPCDTSCCVAATGNVNNDPDDLVDIRDLVALINILYITFEEIACPEEANINGDEEGIIDILDLTALINSLYITFEETSSCM